MRDNRFPNIGPRYIDAGIRVCEEGQSKRRMGKKKKKKKKKKKELYLEQGVLM
jgi:hypothetical protein